MSGEPINLEMHADKRLSPLQEQFLYGGLLGDSSLSKIRKNRRNSCLRIQHSSKQAEYVLYKYSIMKDFVRTPPRVVRNKGWGEELVRFQTLAYPAFTRARQICYKNGRKTISSEWLSKITSPFALAIWYMDDGGLQPRLAMGISTHSFTYEENQILREWLKSRWGTTPEMREDKRRKRYFLHFPAKERDKFMELIRPYVIPSISYKLVGIVPFVKCPICGKEFIPKRNVYASTKVQGRRLICPNPDCKRIAHLRLYYNPSPKQCKICGKTFIPHTGNQVTCSKECSRLYHLQRKRERNRLYRMRKKLKKSTI